MKTNDISLRFRTSLESGTIFYSGGVTDSLELGVVAGRLVIRAHIGSPAGLGRGVAVSKERVDTGSWQNALVRRNGRRLYVRYNNFLIIVNLILIFWKNLFCNFWNTNLLKQPWFNKKICHQKNIEDFSKCITIFLAHIFYLD